MSTELNYLLQQVQDARANIEALRAHTRSLASNPGTSPVAGVARKLRVRVERPASAGAAGDPRRAGLATVSGARGELSRGMPFVGEQPEDSFVQPLATHPGVLPQGAFTNEAGRFGGPDHRLVVRERLDADPMQSADPETVVAQQLKVSRARPRPRAAGPGPARCGPFGCAVDPPQQGRAEHLVGGQVGDGEDREVGRLRVADS